MGKGEWKMYFHFMDFLNFHYVYKKIVILLQI
jgi:hypothetical protein